MALVCKHRQQQWQRAGFGGAGLRVRAQQEGQTCRRGVRLARQDVGLFVVVVTKER